MPELPEVETVRLGIEKAALGKVIKTVQVNRRDLRFPLVDNFETVLAGQRIESVGRRGKYALAFLSGGAVAVLHLGMSGRIRIYGPDEIYQPLKHDHVIFTLAEGARLVFQDPRRFGYILLSDRDTWAGQPPFAAMGPEPLGNDFNGPVLYERLKGKRTPLKAALLDQRVVAGLGNIYVCEALYRARLNPARICADVSEVEAGRLAVCIRDVLNGAIAAGGSTLRDYQKTDGSLGYFQYSFSVYDREGGACNSPDCGSVIARVVQGGRSTFYCAACQK